MNRYYLKPTVIYRSRYILGVCTILFFFLQLSPKSFAQDIKLNFHPGYILPISKNFNNISFGYILTGVLTLRCQICWASIYLHDMKGW
jgi:hypothetical protein